MTIDWTEMLYGGLTVLAFVVLYAILVFVAKWTKDLLTPYSIETELVTNDNLAVGLSVGGYFLATSVIFVGALLGPSKGLVTDLIAVGGYSLLGLAFLNASRLILDKIILHRFSNIHEIVDDKNCGMGAVRGGVYIATGLIAAGSIHGEGGGPVTAIAFFVLGQIGLLVFSRLYDLLTPYSLQSEIENDNVAAGVAYGGTLIAFGIILMKAVSGSFVGWTENLLVFAEMTVVGLVLLPLVRILMDRTILTGVKVNKEIAEDRNIAAGVIEMSIAVCFATVLAVLI